MAAVALTVISVTGVVRDVASGAAVGLVTFAGGAVLVELTCAAPSRAVAGAAAFALAAATVSDEELVAGIAALAGPAVTVADA